MTLFNIYFVTYVPDMFSVYINLFLGWKGTSMEPFYSVEQGRATPPFKKIILLV